MKGYRNKIRMKSYLRWILVVSNWMFQGIIHSDKTEKIYKIFISIFLSGLLLLVNLLYLNIDLVHALVRSIFIGHTLNWAINTNYNSIIIHRLFLSELKKENAFTYLESLSKRLNKQKSVLYATTHGSICNGDLKSSSDIDVALVRKKGLVNALKALLFVVRERKIADFKGIPLEIYLSDTPLNAINRFKKEKNPVVVYDPYNVIDLHYKKRQSILEAKILNGLII